MRLVRVAGVATLLVIVAGPSWCCDGGSRGGSSGAGAQPEARRHVFDRPTRAHGNLAFRSSRQASTLASRVDNLYFFLLATSGVLRRAGHGAGHRFAIRYPPAIADEVGEPIHGSLASSSSGPAFRSLLAMVMFVWGASVYFALVRMPDEARSVQARRFEGDDAAAGARHEHIRQQGKVRPVP